MGHRTTRADLESEISWLNRLSKRRYGLHGAYGGVRLIRYVNDTDTCNGITDISLQCAPKELKEQLRLIFRYLEEEDDSKVWQIAEPCAHIKEKSK